MKNSCLMAIMFQFAKWKEFLAMDGGDGCTTTWMYLMPLNCALKDGWNSKFYVVYISPQLKNTAILEVSSCRKAGAEASRSLLAAGRAASAHLPHLWQCSLRPRKGFGSWGWHAGRECQYTAEQDQTKLRRGHSSSLITSSLLGCSSIQPQINLPIAWIYN